jgi:hypothetical protein
MLQTGPLSGAPGVTALISSWAGPIAIIESCLSFSGGGGAFPISLPSISSAVLAIIDVAIGVGAVELALADVSGCCGWVLDASWSFTLCVWVSAGFVPSAVVDGWAIFSMGTASLGCSRRELSPEAVGPELTAIGSAVADMSEQVTERNRVGSKTAEVETAPLKAVGETEASKRRTAKAQKSIHSRQLRSLGGVSGRGTEMGCKSERTGPRAPPAGMAKMEGWSGLRWRLGTRMDVDNVTYA